MPGTTVVTAVRAPLRRHTPRNGLGGTKGPPRPLQDEVNYPMAFPDPG